MSFSSFKFTDVSLRFVFCIDCIIDCTSCLTFETTKSIRNYSWLSNYKVPIKVIIKSIYLWSCGQLCIISAPVLIRLRKFIFKKIQIYLVRNPIWLGGPNIIVQLDEMKLNHPTWVLTMVYTCTIPAKGCTEIIPNIEAGTIIINSV